MEDVKDRYIKGLGINMQLEHLSTTLLDDLEKIFKKFEGEMPINFNVSNKSKNHKFELYSSDRKIDICPELLDELRRSDIEYQVILKN
jgi:hypothetical protein